MPPRKKNAEPVNEDQWEHLAPEAETDAGFLAPTDKPEGMMAVQLSRAAQEIQAAMIMAKHDPRNSIKAEQRIRDACKRKGLAEVAMYEYKRGDTRVTGPSIRLAEELARCWGNMDSGIIELEQREGESTVMTYAWDLETNNRETRIFTVKHLRYTRSGSYALDDPRDIYEMTANMGARRLRACILAIIPGDVQELAILECERTLAGDNKEPIIDRAKRMVIAFADLGANAVNQSQIEKLLGHRLEAVSETELVRLRKIFTALRDGIAKWDQYFQAAEAVPAGAAKAVPRQAPIATTNIPERPPGAAPDGEAVPQTVPTATVPTDIQPRKKAAQREAPAVQVAPAPAAAPVAPAAAPIPAPVAAPPPPPAPAAPVAPATPNDPLIILNRPYESLMAVMERDGVTEDQVLALAKVNKLARSTTIEVGQMMEANMVTILSNWAEWLPQLRGIEI